MRLKAYLFLFLLPLFGLLFSRPAFADTYTLSGTVQDSAGHAIGGATVTVNDSNADTTTTDATTGSYSFSAVLGGTYNIQVTPPSGSGFSPAIALSKTISANTTLNFILTPSGTVTLSGHVYDASGTTPLQNQTVRLIGGSNPSTTTNQNGFFSLSTVPGTYIIEIITVTNNSLSVNAPQYYSVDVNNYSLTQSTSVDFTLPLKKVTVHAQDANSSPVGNVQIKTLNPFTNVNSSLRLGNGLTGVVQDAYGNNVTGPVTDPTTGNATLWLFPTDANHTYTFQAVPPSGGNYVTTTLSNQSITSDTTVPITLQQAVTLTGHIYDSSGVTPLQNQTVRFIGGSNPSTTTDGNGFFSLSAAPGTYTLEIITVANNSLSVNAPQYYSIDVNNYSLTQSTNLNFTLPLKKVIVHTQNSFNAPVGNIQIKTLNPFTNVNTSLSLGNGLTGVVQDAYGNNVTGPATDPTTGNATLWLFSIDANHSYTFQAVPPTGSVYATTTSSSQSITSDTTVSITMQQPVTLSGHVYDASGTTPLQNQTVRLIGGSNPSTTTDGNGFFSLSANAGTYTIEIITVTNNSLSVNAPQYYSVDVNNYSLTGMTSLDFTLPLKKVTVHVQDANNSPVENVQIKTLNPFTNVNTSLSLGNGLIGVVQDAYGNNVTGPVTGSTTGDAVLWLFPSDSSHSYTFQAIPPSGSIYSTVTVSNVPVTSNPVQTELISLQYNHAVPATTANLATQNTDGTYADPTTVTLSATAASGYTIANTYYTVDGGAQQTYTAPFTVTGSGSHTITYWSVDNAGVPEAANTKTFTIYTNKAPVVGSLSNATINEGNTYSATDSFTDADSTSWTATVDYGDGSGVQPLTLSGQNFSLSHVYKDNGTYTVTVNVTDNQGATGTTSATIIVNNVAPTVGAIAAPTSPVEPNTPVSVTANFTDPGILDTHTVVWNWGDGSTSTGTVTENNGNGSVTDTHTYTSYGKFTITLTVTDKDGGVGTQTTQTFVNAPPVANAGGTYTMNEGDTILLTGSATDPDGDSLTYAWDLNNDGTYGLTGQTALFSAQDGPATKTVNLKVCDSNGSCDVSAATIVVNNVAPTVTNVTVTPNQLQQGDTTSVTANFTDQGVLDTHTAIIDWGDGTTSTGTVSEANGAGTVSGSHAYTTFGTYTVTVTVTDNNSGVGSNTASLFVNATPTANAGGSYTANEGDMIILNGSGTDPDGDTLTYKWDLNNDGVYDVTGQSTVYSAVDGPATKTVTFQACDSYNACATDTAKITINNVNPTVGTITAPTTPVQVNTAISASANFTDPGTLDTHTATWNWGDGTTSTGTVTESNGNGSVANTHTYTTAGIYTISLSVTDKDGGVGQKSFIYVVVYDPSAGWASGSKDFTSPAGAVVGNTSATGTASFGFQVKYQNGSMVPSGKNVVLDFPIGNISFSSTGYEWLVVNGSTATFKADGTLNGVSGYTALVSATDTGSGNPSGLVRFQIKDSNGNVVYDTQSGAGDTANPTTSVTKGQIAIH